MSIVHIKIEKIKEDSIFVEYKILCSDFNSFSQTEDFGIIKINKHKKTFLHKNNDLWVKNKIYPIKLFELPPQKRKVEVDLHYKNYANGMWAITLFQFINRCIQKKSYPKEKLLIA